MLLTYNIIQICGLLLFAPLIVAIVLLRAKYRSRFMQRCGFGLTNFQKQPGQKTIWIHALSVGEVTSALPLVLGLNNDQEKNIQIVFSTTTRAGFQTATTLLGRHVSRIIPFPLDLQPVIILFLNRIRPDIFILVETDFWPNILATLKHKNIPTVLVNGRISRASLNSYKRFSFFFSPLFSSFDILCMQTEADKENMVDLGVAKELIHTPGNLKYDTPEFPAATGNELSRLIPDDVTLLIAGSTHEGEEKIIFQVYQALRLTYPGLYLVLAPRDIQRGSDILKLANSLKLEGSCRSSSSQPGKDLLILDTLGELAGAYRIADLAFIGGSLVPQGGHNPIEAAVMGTCVLFGPHMEDFAEISADLVATGGGMTVNNQKELQKQLDYWLTNRDSLLMASTRAREFVLQHQGTVQKHLQLIGSLL